jgi:hypothetical protein
MDQWAPESGASRSCAMKNLLGLVGAISLFAATNTIVTFDSVPVGQVPPGWSVRMTNRGQAPRWEVRQDISAPTGPNVLAQMSNDPTVNRSPLAILDDTMLRDGDLSVRIKPVGGHEMQGGLVWRYRDENNYYLARTNAIDKTVAVYKVQNGQRTPLMPGATRDIPSNGWSTLKVSVRGNRFQVYVDHRRILQGWDSTFIHPGKVGLWTGADAVTYFDDFRVDPR